MSIRLWKIFPEYFTNTIMLPAQMRLGSQPHSSCLRFALGSVSEVAVIHHGTTPRCHALHCQSASLGPSV